jgi:hypothetical protein
MLQPPAPGGAGRSRSDNDRLPAEPSLRGAREKAVSPSASRRCCSCTGHPHIPPLGRSDHRSGAPAVLGLPRHAAL